MTSRALSSSFVAVFAAALWSCEASINMPSPSPGEPPIGQPPFGGGGGGSPVDPLDPTQPALPPFTCDANAAPVATQTRRLTTRQLERTLTDVLGRLLGASQARALVSSALASAALPADTERYKRWSNEFSSAHAQSLFVLADLLAKGAAQSAQAFTAAAIAFDRTGCATFDPATVACQSRLIRNLGLRLLRRPLSDAEVDAYRAEYTAAAPDAATRLNNLVFRMLLAPDSLFHLEVNGAAVPGEADRLRLSSHALANRLSYTLWNAPPDETLLSMAAASDLQAEAQFTQALQYVASRDDRLVASTDEFFDDWLQLEKVPEFKSSDPTTFALYAGGVKCDAALRAEMQSEVRELGAFVTREGGTLKDLFTTQVSFARGAELMKLYGASAPAPTTVTAANAVSLPSGQRPGLLSRAALLVTAAGNKNPVMRGVHVLTDVLCMPPTPPPGNLPADAFAPPPLDESLTARERYAQKTSVQPCYGCHQRLNLPGYALSNYNGLGRFEETEPGFRADGTYAGRQLLVDAKVDLSMVLGPGTQVTSPTELGQLLGQRPETHKCFTQQYGRFFLGRELTGADGCGLNAVYAALIDGKPLREAMQALARQPAFRLKKL